MLFHIVINPNIPHDRASQIGIAKIRARLRYLAKTLVDNIELFSDGPVDLADSEFYQEIGGRLGYVHMDGFIIFKGRARLRYNDIRALCNAIFDGFSNGVHFHARPSSDEAIIQYARKDSDRLL